MGSGSAALTYSKSRVRKAGVLLRKSSSTLPPGEESEAVRIVSAFRADHAYPLTMVSANLRYYVDKHAAAPGSDIAIAQRLKRLPTILMKLRRFPSMDLDRMGDIAGCRAVLPTEAEVRAVVADLAGQKRWDIRNVKDYISTPKPDGYRAIHLDIRKDDRMIEVQIRTQRQHEWAEFVEGLDRDTGIGIKEGRAPDDVVRYVSLGAELIAAEESGHPPSPAAVQEFVEIAPTARATLLRNRG